VIDTEAEKIRKAIDAIKKDRPEYSQVLDLFGKIVIKQSEFLHKVKVKRVAIAKDAARAKLKKGTPLLSRKDFPIDLSSASQLFDEVSEILKSGNPDASDDIEKIQNALENGDLALEKIFQSLLTDDGRISELAESLSLDRDTILALATISVKPSLETVASQVRDVVGGALWSERYCPVCGSDPAISELRQLASGSMEGATIEGAERILYCSFCGTQWRTMRLGCVFCDNTDSESLGYFFTEEEKGYRIDVCEKCRKYIKTMDSRVISHDLVPLIEDFSTLHLDMIAEEEGFEREAWLMPYGMRPSGK
jgi:FdhE protein